MFFLKSVTGHLICSTHSRWYLSLTDPHPGLGVPDTPWGALASVLGKSYLNSGQGDCLVGVESVENRGIRRDFLVLLDVIKSKRQSQSTKDLADLACGRRKSHCWELATPTGQLDCHSTQRKGQDGAASFLLALMSLNTQDTKGTILHASSGCQCTHILRWGLRHL